MHCCVALKCGGEIPEVAKYKDPQHLLRIEPKVIHNRMLPFFCLIAFSVVFSLFCFE